MLYCIPDICYLCKEAIDLSSNCKSICGNGIKAANEDCDDGN
jgi:hypothetical protein